MKPFIATVAAITLLVVGCTFVATTPLARSNDIALVGEPLTSEYVTGATSAASLEAFVSANELSGNGVKFTSISLSKLSSLIGPFAYISRKCDQGTTIYTMDVFTNYQVAEYEATQVEALSLFLIQGDETQAKKNMVLWCQDQGPQTREEVQAGINKVICFSFLEVE